jgi:nucleotide-binding universal stress UspA family protein
MKVLVATDGSQSALAAVRFASRIAAAAGGNLIVLTVGRSDIGRPFASDFHEAYRRAAQKALDEARREAARHAVRAKGEYMVGKALEPVAETISRAADRLRADLIVVGSRGGTPLTRWALGSIANRLLHVARASVAVVRPSKSGSRWRSVKILVATDGSPAASQAVRFGARLASSIPRARLAILTVSTLTADLALTGVGVVRGLGLLPELERADLRAAQRVLEAAARRARLNRRVTRRYYRPRRRLSAAEAIVAEAKREKANLIVVGRTGRSALGDAVLGSVAQRVLAVTRLPVVLVPAPPRRVRRKP